MCIRACVRRAVVDTSTDGWQKRIAPAAPMVACWYDELLAGTLDRVSWTGEERWIMSGCCCGFQGSSQGKEELLLTVRAPGDGRPTAIWVSGTTYESGVADLVCGGSLPCSGQPTSSSCRADKHPPPLADLHSQFKLSFPHDHGHREDWFLAEPSVGLDVGSLLEHSTKDIVGRGRVG